MKKKYPDHEDSEHHNLQKSTPAATFDFIGRDMRIRKHVIGVIRRLYEQHGFSPQDTPIIENAIVFAGHHGEGEEILFRLQDKHGIPLVLRYDQTVPLGRIVATHADLPYPYRRFQIAYAFRDEDPDGRHLRQFIQCDADTVGCSSLAADAEAIMLAYRGLRELGFKWFIIRINHRRIFQAIASLHGLNEEGVVKGIQRAIDKSDKHTREGLEGLKKDLSSYGLSNPVIQTIVDILALKGNPGEILNGIGRILAGQVTAERGIAEIREILSYLPTEVMSVIEIDVSLSRGADYYTGFILEGVINEGDQGAVLGGGRYDNLVEAFGAPPEPAVGMAFGLDRIISTMKSLDMLDGLEVDPDRTLVVSGREDSVNDVIMIAEILRNQLINVSTVFASVPPEKQAELARSQNCTVVVGINQGVEISCVDGNGTNLIELVSSILADKTAIG